MSEVLGKQFANRALNIVTGRGWFIMFKTFTIKLNHLSWLFIDLFYWQFHFNKFKKKSDADLEFSTISTS